MGSYSKNHKIYKRFRLYNGYALLLMGVTLVLDANIWALTSPWVIMVGMYSMAAHADAKVSVNYIYLIGLQPFDDIPSKDLYPFLETSLL